jgi:transcriptional regulator with XRE-family HTH domain
MIDNSPKADPRLDTARENLRMAVALRGTNYKAASLQAGLSQNALSTFVKGGSSMSYINLLRICDVLGIPIGVLHVSGAITPARLRLHALLAQVGEERMTQVLRILTEIDR